MLVSSSQRVDLEKFNSLIDYKEDTYKGKIVSYILDNSKDLQAKFKELEENTGLEVINIARKNFSAGEFLKAIKDCEIFLTDSFHGTCFALLYHKKFLALKNESRGTARFDSLIETFNIKNSFISEIKEFSIENIEKSIVNWNFFDNRIQEEKIKFENWFEKTFIQQKNITLEQIVNEFDFEKYKTQKEYNQKEKVKIWKYLFSTQKLGTRKIFTILGIKIKVH